MERNIQIVHGTLSPLLSCTFWRGTAIEVPGLCYEFEPADPADR